MGFTTEPKAGPTIVKPYGAEARTPSAVSAREAAIRAFQASSEQPPEVTTQAKPAEVTQSVQTNLIEGGQNGDSEGTPSVETSSSESPATETPAVKEEPISTQYAILARKEKALRAKAQAQESALKAKESAIQAREEALKAKDAEYLTKYIPKDRLTNDPFGALSEVGMTYDQLVEKQMNAPSPESQALLSKLDAAMAKIEALEKGQEASKKSFEDQQKQSYDNALKSIERDATRLINNDSSFETIKGTGSIKEVVKLIEKTFNEDGDLLTVEEACQQIEEELVDRILATYKINKIQERLKTAGTPATQTKPQVTQQLQKPVMKTLTNSASGPRKLSAKERAILAFKGEPTN